MSALDTPPPRERLPISRAHADALLDRVERSVAALTAENIRITVERDLLIADIALHRAGFYDATLLRATALLSAEVRRLRMDCALLGGGIRLGMMAMERGRPKEAHDHFTRAEGFSRQNACARPESFPAGVVDLIAAREARIACSMTGGAL